MRVRATWDWHRWAFGFCWSTNDRRRFYFMLLCLEVVVVGRERKEQKT